MLQMLSESVIVSALRSGHLRRALELILDTYQDDVFGYCARLVGLHDAPRLYHQVMISALEQLTAYPGNISVRAWLYGIARNTILQLGNRDRPDRPGTAELSQVGFGLRLSDEALQTSFAKLDPTIGEILKLSLWHGLLLSEVAYIIGRSELQVRRLAAQGLSYLSLELRRIINIPS